MTNKSANVHIHGITLRNITATGWKSSKGGNDGSAGWFNCADKVPCTDLTLESVHVFRDAAGKTPAPAFRCDHAFGTAVDTTPSAACLQKLKLDDDGTHGASVSATGGLQFLAPFNPDFETSLENNESLPTFGNLNFAGDVALLAYAYRQTKVPGMLSLEATHMPNTVWNYQLLPEGKNGSGLQPGWESALERIMDRALPLLKSGILRGIFMGDEICCSHVPYANFSAVASIVRQKLDGTDAIIYANECTQPFVRTGETWTIPSKLDPALDYISIDSCPSERCFLELITLAVSLTREACSHVDVGRNLCDGSTTKELEVFKTFLEEQLRPRLHDHQRVLLVPGLYGDRNTTRSGSMAEQEEYLLAKLEHYYEYAQAEPLIAGLVPWHWSSPPKGYTIYNTVYGLGISAFPKLVARLNEIGKTMSRADAHKSDDTWSEGRRLPSFLAEAAPPGASWRSALQPHHIQLLRQHQAGPPPTCPNASWHAAAQGAGLLSVKLFGAVGDGSHDDAPAARAAMNASDACGGCVFFPPGGTYFFATTVALRGCVKGGGGGGGVQDQGRSEVTISGGGKGTPTVSVSAMNVLVQDLVFYGDTIAIYIANAAIVRFVNVGAQIESDADHVDASVEGCNRTACNVVLGSMNAALVVENSVRLTISWCKRNILNPCVLWWA